MNWLKWIVAVLFVLYITYLLGPEPDKPKYSNEFPTITQSGLQLDDSIKNAEADLTIREGNQAEIIWYDSTHSKTPYSLVYLHGFSASRFEGNPVHQEFAKRYGCNLYLSRLASHGLKTDEPLLNLSADDLYKSAKRALAIGNQIGEKVILMSTSTGGTLSILLAAKFPEKVEAIIAYSPNVEIYDPNSYLLTKPWGLQMARLVLGSKYRTTKDHQPGAEKYWYTKYRAEGIVALQKLVETSMHWENFQRVEQPFFMGYFYKNDSIHDKTVSVPAMLEMFETLGTPEKLKRKVAFPEAGDHVIANKMTSKAVNQVKKETFAFAEDILGLKPVNNVEPIPEKIESEKL